MEINFFTSLVNQIHAQGGRCTAASPGFRVYTEPVRPQGELPMIRRLCCFALLWAMLPVAALAERAQDFGEYVVHFNALNTDLIAPSVASNYGLRRSPYQALLNMAVLRKVMGTTGEPVVAGITGTVSNLTGRTQQLSPREIREGNAIYYIETFRVNNEETLNFDLTIRPQGSEAPLQLRFSQQFFVE